MTDVSTAPESDERRGDASDADRSLSGLVRRISRPEVIVAAIIATILLVLVVIEPDILEAPFQNGRTLIFTIGGTLIAALAFAAMLWFRVPPLVRIVVLVVPFVIVNWWLLEPYFVDDVVDEEFSVSIADLSPSDDDVAVAPPPTAAPPDDADDPADATAGDGTDGATDVAAGEGEDDASNEENQETPTEGDAVVPPSEPAVTEAPEPAPGTTAAPTGPVLLGAGQFVGLAGHDGTGDAGIFRNPDGTLVLRFENFDIENGPDLEVYLVPGAGQTDLAAGSIHLGALKGNVGDQNYEFAGGTELPPGEYTALVWCEAFSVEFVGATITV